MADTYGELIRQRREALGLSQGAVAEMCPRDSCVYQSRLSRWEQDKSFPNRAQAEALHEVLRLTKAEAEHADAMLTELDRRAMADKAEAIRLAKEAKAAEEAA